MEGYFPRLLGLDKNEDYRRRYRAVQKLEQKTVELTVSFSNAQKKVRALRYLPLFFSGPICPFGPMRRSPGSHSRMPGTSRSITSFEWLRTSAGRL